MDKSAIFEVVKKNILDILPDIETAITINHSLKELGANSIDRADIVTQSLEELQLTIPLVKLAEAKNIEGLVNIFHHNAK